MRRSLPALNKMTRATSEETRLIEFVNDKAAYDLLLAHQRTRTLVGPTRGGGGKRTQLIHDNESFWHPLIKSKSVDWPRVSLSDFRIFEWTPRAPGQFHTRDAYRQRENAAGFIRDVDEPLDHFLELSESPPDHAESFRARTKGFSAEKALVFNPYGKASMIRGGVGCVRLKPLYLDGDEYWVMGASSSIYADEGVPILIPSEIYWNLKEEIAESGYASASTVEGDLRFVPKVLAGLYKSRSGVPSIYVKVDKVVQGRFRGRAFVSVAASFLSEFEGDPGIYATYVTFDPGWPGARESASNWLKNDYVSGLYGGSIITDFDQQAPAFSEALFSLDRVLGGGELAAVVSELNKLYGYVDWSELERTRITLNKAEAIYQMNQTINAQGSQVNAVLGSGTASMTGNSLGYAVDPTKLAHELDDVETALKAAPATEDNTMAHGRIVEARKAAKNGDSAKAVKSLSDDHGIARTVLGFATGIAAPILTKVIGEVLANAIG